MTYTENELSTFIVDAAIEVHRNFGGPGLLESVYHESLAWELSHRGFEIESEKVIPLVYKGNNLGKTHRLDIVVNNLVIVECKAIYPYHKIFEAQLLTQLRLTNLRLGLVVNFGERLVSDGIHRVVNNLEERPSINSPKGNRLV